MKSQIILNLQKSYEHPEISAICLLYLSRIAWESRDSEATHKYSAMYQKVEAGGKIENSWIFDLKNRLENDKKSEEERTIKILIGFNGKTHATYEKEFKKQLYEKALALHHNNIPQTATFLGCERSGFSKLIKRYLPHLIKTRKRKTKPGNNDDTDILQ